MVSINAESFLVNNFVWQGLSVTKTAADRILLLMQKNQKIKGLKLSLKNSGCAGFKYVIDLVETIDSTDIQFSYHGVTIFVSSKEMPFIDGTKIDYINDGLNQMFKFNNPKAQYSCGCGESFSIE